MMEYFSLSKIRRGGYLFVTWIGDHAPRHVHVYRDRKEVMKFDLENFHVMSGKSEKKIISLIHRLINEGLL